MNSFVRWTIGGAVVSIAIVYSLIALGVLPSASGTGIILWVIVVFTQVRANRTKPDAPGHPSAGRNDGSRSREWGAPLFALGMSVFYVGSAFGAGWLSGAIAGRFPPVRVQQGFVGLALMLVGIAILTALAVRTARAAGKPVITGSE